MGTPAQATTDNSDVSQVVDKSFAEQVNDAIDNMTTNEDGSHSFPEDLSEEVKYTANSERRRRDTQGALAKEKNTSAILQAENEDLVELVKQDKTVHLTPDEQTELEELKFTDPDEWRKRVNDLERVSQNKVDTTLSDISTKAQAKGSLGEREVLLSAFLDDNPGLVINDEVLTNEIPPRITKALENGEVSFIQFLGNVKDYLQAGKVVKDTPASDDPNLTDVGGNDTPSDEAQKGANDTAYEDAIF